MADKLRESIYSNMQLLSTVELAKIWKENNTEEWSQTAFDVIEEILLARGRKLPPQDLPTIASANDESTQEEEEEENPPEFYNPQQVLALSKWASLLSYLLAGTILLIGFIEIVQIIMHDAYGALYAFPYFFQTFGKAIVQAVFYFIILQAAKKGLLVLMEFEFNSREF